MRRALPAALGVVWLVSLANASRRLGIPPPWTASLAFSASLLWAAWDARRAQRRGLLDAPAHGTLFLLCLTVYLATLRWHGGDDIPNSLIPFGILRRGTLTLEPFRAKFEAETLADFVVPGTRPLLSMFSVVPALLALPVYLLPAAFGEAPNDFGLHNLSKLSGALVTAASVSVVYAACRRRTDDGRWAAACALWYGLGTWSLSVSSQALHSHGPAQLGLALGMLGLVSGERPRDAALAGLGFALSVSSREDGVFFLAAAGLYVLLCRPRLGAAFAAGAAGPLAVAASYWLWTTGRLRPPYYGAQAGMFTGVQWDAAWAMLASPTRGLVFFCPAALFGLRALARGRDWRPFLLAASAAQLVFIATRTSWTGGQTFGTRYFAAACAVWAVALAGERPPALAWAAAFAVSVAIHARGAFFPYPGSFMLEAQRAQLWDWGLHPLADAAGLVCAALAVPLGLWQRRFLSGA